MENTIPQYRTSINTRSHGETFLSNWPKKGHSLFKRGVYFLYDQGRGTIVVAEMIHVAVAVSPAVPEKERKKNDTAVFPGSIPMQADSC